jgi:spore coat polysaccharide biosynthesis protein SpsF (cytidylyltransferase family)
MTTTAMLIARLSSTRLPAKNIKQILGRPMIELLAERVSQASSIDQVMITTSDQPSDDPLEDLAGQLGIGCYRGSLDNVMERISGAATAADCDHVVEILGDNPFVHSELIDDVVGLHLQGDYDYVSNITNEYEQADSKLKRFSLGIRVQVYKRKLAEAYVDYPETDNYSAYMFNNPDVFKVGYLEAAGKWLFANRPGLNFAVNYKKNFEFANRVFTENYDNAKNFTLESIYQQLDKQPELIELLGAE